MGGIKLIFLPHTHWDREWYLPFERFREKLVGLIDQLVKIMNADANYKYFLLDGQTIVLEDYFEVKGENPDLLRLILAGRIGIGPWYILPDEFLVSGEAIIRNLKRGFELSRKFGVEPVKVGYLPDMFGHISQMPQIFRGFGIDTAVVWRGVPKMEKNQFRWQTRDGSSVLALYLPIGYGMFYDLPDSADEFLKKLSLLFPLIKMRDDTGVYLVMVGTDHWPPEASLPELLNRANELKKDWQMEMGTLEGFFAQLKSRLDNIPGYAGELRNNDQTNILPSVASSRLYLKEMNHRASALLEKYLEPMAALDAIGSGADLRGRLDYMWKLLLSNHPHDSICGCSVDAVHVEMENRFKKIFELADLLLETSLASLACPEGPVPDRISVWNPCPAAAPGVLRFESELFPDQHLALEDEDGKIYPLERVEQVSEEEVLYQFEVAAGFAWMTFSWLSPDQIMGYYHNSLTIRPEGDKLFIDLGLGARPVNFPIRREFVRIKEMIEQEKFSTVAVRLLRLPTWRMLALADELKGPGISRFKVNKGRAQSVSWMRSSKTGLENQLLKIGISDSGAITILDLESGKEIHAGFSDRADRGDSYNFDPVAGEEPARIPDKFKPKPGPKGKNFASLELEHNYRLPEALAPDRSRRSDRKVWLRLHTRIFLYSGMRRVDFETSFENTLQDHRLQVDFSCPGLADQIQAESPFELVKRKIEKEVAPPAPAAGDIFSLLFGTECKYATGPAQNFACLEGKELGMILAGRGLSEVSAEKDPAANQTRLSFTLCRSIGYLARPDLTFRSGLAGPTLQVPDAQCLRKFKWNYSLMLFNGSADAASVFSRAYQFVFPPLVFPGESRVRLPFKIKSPKIILSAFYPGRDQNLVARLFNSSPQAERLEMDLGSEVSRAWPLSLEEKEITRPDFKLGHNQLETILKPGEIFTLGLEITKKEQRK